MCVLSFIYIYVAVCSFCAVRCVIIICFSLLFSNYLIYFFNILFMFVFFFCMFVFYFVYYGLCIFLCIGSPSAYSCLFPIFVQVYRSLPPGRNPNSVNKFNNNNNNNNNVCSLKFTLN